MIVVTNELRFEAKGLDAKDPGVSTRDPPTEGMTDQLPCSMDD